TMERKFKTVLAMGLALAFGVVALAATAAKGPVNDKCPLKGEDVSADKTADVAVKVCSAACKEKFEKDPGAFLAKLTKYPNTTCPVDAKAVKDMEATLTVAFCCGNCQGTFTADI